MGCVNILSVWSLTECLNICTDLVPTIKEISLGFLLLRTCYMTLFVEREIFFFLTINVYVTRGLCIQCLTLTSSFNSTQMGGLSTTSIV